MPTSMRTATVALAVLLAGCAASVGVESPNKQPSAAATASPTPVPATFGAVDLPRIVLSEEMGRDVRRRSPEAEAPL